MFSTLYIQLYMYNGEIRCFIIGINLKTAEYMQMQGYSKSHMQVASYFEMHVRGCYIVEVYDHMDQQENDSKNNEESQNRN